jgi:hypothetical protein
MVRHLKEGGRKDLAIGGHDENVWTPGLDGGQGLRRTHAVRLKDRESEIEGGPFDGRRLRVPSSTGRAVGLADDPYDGEPLGERSQRRHGEIGGPKEGDPHWAILA